MENNIPIWLCEVVNTAMYVLGACVAAVLVLWWDARRRRREEKEEYGDDP